MRHVFVDDALAATGSVVIVGPVRHHLADVVRLRPGERLVLRHPDGTCRIAEAEDIGRSSIKLTIVGEGPSIPPPPCAITVVQAPGKGDRFERVLQHGTEIGVARFIPILTQRSAAVAARDPATLTNKMRRWEAVLRSAAEQSQRDTIPQILRPMSVRQALDEVASGCSRMLLLDQSGDPVLGLARDNTADPVTMNYALFVGPEGGFTDEEKAAIISAGALTASVTPFVLRTETAALAAASVLMAHAMARR